MSRLVLVTGASGFVGRHLVAALAARGHAVRAAARDPGTVPAAAGVSAAAMPDLAAPPVDWRPLLAGVSHVVHLAGLAHATRRIPEADYMAVNATATIALAEAATRSGVQRLVLVSSVRAQSGPVAERVLREHDRPAPTDAYGRSKLAAETGLWRALASGGTSGVVLRPVLVYGPSVKGNLRALTRLARLPLPLPLAALRGRRSLVSIANLASAIAHVLEAPAAAGGTFLVADDEPLGVADIVTSLRHGLGRGPGLVHLPAAPLALLARGLGRADAWQRLVGDLVVDTAALRATGWRAPEETRQALAAMMRGA